MPRRYRLNLVGEVPVPGLAIVLPIRVMGYRPETVPIFLAVDSAHGNIGHINIAIRAGQVRHPLIGSESHRNHHSADVAAETYRDAVLALLFRRA